MKQTAPKQLSQRQENLWQPFCPDPLAVQLCDFQLLLVELH